MINQRQNKKTMDKRRIEKYYKEEPSSFEDFVKRFLKKDPDKLKVCKRSTVPLYMVNKVSGFMQEIAKPAIFTEKFNTRKDLFCSIAAYDNNCNILATFHISHNDRYKDKMIEFYKGNLDDFYAGNYAIFLHQKDAAKYAKEIFLKKREKLDKEIELLTFLEI